MKKVLLKAYMHNNLGDDLFVYMLLKRYKDNFYTYEYERNYTLSKFENLSYEKNGIENLIDRCFSKFLKKYDYTELKNKKKYDLLVDIGGSLFIENGNYDSAYNRYKNSILVLEEQFAKPKLKNRFVKTLKLRNQNL